MLTDITGSNATLGSINRPEPRAPQAPTPARQEPTPQERQTPSPDVQVNTTLDRRTSAERSLVQEASNLAISQQSRGEVVDQLRTERDLIAEGGSTELTEGREQLSAQAADALQEIRERALSEPFGEGIDDLGPLPDNSFFIRDRGETLSNLDGTISALERFSEAESSQLDQLQQTFNASQDERLSPDNTAIESADEAETAVIAVQQQLAAENITDANGLTSIEASTVLDALQSDQSPGL
ncbi:hypothetical protein [Saccharospirillum impatiens]|uniref:hypothetical protein n=1 Tax=Saccharospirillum impatiens TaxID=169438 RepID=UPI00040208A5|nr:hypothetical protein [Saccharospirillum impatiens]